jgi:hypothetical protein
MRSGVVWIVLPTLMLAIPALADHAAASPAAAGHDQAAARIELLHFGCTSVVDIQRNPDGSWAGQCTKGGSIIPVDIRKGGTVWSPVQQSDG